MNGAWECLITRDVHKDLNRKLLWLLIKCQNIAISHPKVKMIMFLFLPSRQEGSLEHPLFSCLLQLLELTNSRARWEIIFLFQILCVCVCVRLWVLFRLDMPETLPPWDTQQPYHLNWLLNVKEGHSELLYNNFKKKLNHILIWIHCAAGREKKTVFIKFFIFQIINKH